MTQRKLILLLMAVLMVLLMAGTGQTGTILTGTVLQVGVSNSGALISDTSTPGPYPTWPGVTGLEQGASIDWSKPGTSFEGFSIGTNGAFVANGYYGAPGTYTYNNPMGTTTVDKTSGTLLSAHTDGDIFSVGGASLRITQDVTFDKTSNTIYMSTDIANVGSSNAYNVYFARFIDPDPDLILFGSYTTNNLLTTYGGKTAVVAVGPLTGANLYLVDLTGGGVPSIQSGLAGGTPSPWPIDPSYLYNGGVPYSDGNGDYSINMAWDITELDVGHSYEIDYEYVVPLPPAVLLFGTGLAALGLLRSRRKIS